MDEQMIQRIFDLMKSTLDRVEKLEGSFNEILNLVNDSKVEYDTNQRRDGFRERNSEALSKFNDKLKAIEGDDFDVVDEAFAEYDKMENKPEEAEYIAALIAKIDAQLARIAKAYGVEEVQVKHDEEKTEVAVDEDDNGTAETDEKVAEVEREEPEEEEVEEEGIDEEDPEDDPEEVEKFVKELEEEAKHLR